MGFGDTTCEVCGDDATCSYNGRELCTSCALNEHTFDEWKEHRYDER